MRFISLFAASAVVSVTTALTSSLQEVTAFITGPTAAKMYIYVPANISTPAPIIVAVHYCTGSGPGYFSATKYASLADTHNFIVIYPSAPSSGGCWDVSSNTSLTHRSGGDSLTIVNMVSYAVSSYGGDASKVFVTGSSSGAMMTNVLAGAYPDIFSAGSVYSGVPDGCFFLASAQAGTDSPGWNSACSSGSVVKTATEWGALVKNYYPGYTGTYPRMQIFHGTSDMTLAYANLAEEMKEWSNLLGVNFSSNITDTPTSGYTKMVYGKGDNLVGYSALGVGHTVPVHENLDLAWFGIA